MSNEPPPPPSSLDWHPHPPFTLKMKLLVLFAALLLAGLQATFVVALVQVFCR